ncbi:virB8 family protein [Massilia pseudoviolaceinigra]|uniref:virB8 family protein n=1 Tax=Massilia pseudoviolaceinigra TaxID=3057165 RepID=UPI002796871F|nr:VirB8/TrbF family protein [Massilia sp. CCM 9206]MDQ1922677.1 VirB8/TrbF family protein [Massilia sp. CCM 9206]
MSNNAPVKAADEAAFYKEAGGWEADRLAMLHKSERRAWRIAGGASLLALAAVIGLSTLAPFRRTVPYLFGVDKATGNVEYVGAVDDRAVTGYQELLDKHWAARYVVARESYNYKLLQSDYDAVLGLSDDNVGKDFARLYEGPNARDKKYGASMEMRVAVISVQRSQNSVGTVAVVRFSKTTRRVEGDVVDPPQYFVATLAYEYKPSMFGKEQDLIANPLGYKVTSYRADSELAPVIVPPAGAPAGAPAAAPAPVPAAESPVIPTPAAPPAPVEQVPAVNATGQ